MALGLAVSDLVRVAITLTPQPAQQPNVNTLLVIGTSSVIDTSERMRKYTSITAVAADFGTTAPEYLAALPWFAQDPEPTEIFVGRWAKTPTAGRLVGGRVAIANQLITAWTSINNGSFSIIIGGVTLNVLNINLSAQTNLNGVASQIQAALLGVGAPVGTTVVWDAAYQRFVIKTGSIGSGATISFASAATSGTDISVMLALRSTSSGAYAVNGMASETAIAAVQEMDNQFGSRWYSVSVLGASDADVLDIAAYIEADSPKHYQWVTTQEGGVVSSVDTTSLPYILKQAGYDKTGTQYSSTNPYAMLSAAGRILTTRWNAPDTTITLMYKREPGVVAELLNENQMAALLAKNCNVFVEYANDTAIFQPGVSASGQFIDTVIGADWFAGRLQTAIFNLLYTTPTKIPQTDAGMNMIKSVIERVCVEGVTNGWLAPGQWNSNGVGEINPGDYLPKGFYVYMPPIASQDQSDRANRISVPFTVLAKLAGAVHTVDVAVQVNP